MKKIHEFMMKIFDNVMFISSGLVCVLIVVGAVMRYILKKDFYGSEEVILLIAFWMYFIGSAFATHEGSQISADLISSSLGNERHKIILKVAQRFIELILFGVLTWWAFRFGKFSIETGQKTQVYKIPMIASLSSVLLSFVLSMLYSAINIYKDIKQYRSLKEVEA